MALIVFSTELALILFRPLKISFVSSRDKISEGFEGLGTRAIQVFSPARSSTAKRSVISWWPIAFLAFPDMHTSRTLLLSTKATRDLFTMRSRHKIMAATNAISSASKNYSLLSARNPRHGLDSY